MARVLDERSRHFHLPGSEWDARHTPNDWISIIGSYVHREASRNGQSPSREDFEDSMIKAAAIIVAALEHTSVMESQGKLRDPPK